MSGLGNFSELMKQAQRMQRDMGKIQEELKERYGFETEVERLWGKGKTVMFLGVDSQVMGIIAVADLTNLQQTLGIHFND